MLSMVALRKESVDRNSVCFIFNDAEYLVALRKESVDRNSIPMKSLFVLIQSLSARRAWIEIFSKIPNGSALTVALRKESVDRNARVGILISAVPVALRKESVDRNS